MTSTSGNYSASLLGTIRSHLEGLQGYDVMALELIQNADDAKAKELIFDITDKGLFVRNDGSFSYCKDLAQDECAFMPNTTCDYHRIIKVANGGKLSHSENIGRFGIGFVSTYQITDQPEIKSTGIKLTLHPETAKWFSEPCDQLRGTEFFLPWALDANSKGRKALGVSSITPDLINQLTEDFKQVITKSLLFLRHITKAEVLRNGELLLGCDLVRDASSDLIIDFRPTGDIEHWHVLNLDVEKKAQALYQSHSYLKSLGRSTKVSVALRLDPAPLSEGFLYAFLPTEQSTGLPFHINADFFPEADRKALIFSGHQHQQLWNEMLIEAAAYELARDLEGLLDRIGAKALWQILHKSSELILTNHPKCYKAFWESLSNSAAQSKIHIGYDQSLNYINDVIITDTKQNLSKPHFSVLEIIGLKTISEDLRSYRNTMTKLGIKAMTLDNIINTIENYNTKVQKTHGTKVPTEQIISFYKPLWQIVNSLLNQTRSANFFKNEIARLKNLIFLISSQGELFSGIDLFTYPDYIGFELISTSLPTMKLLHQDALALDQLKGIGKPLNFSSLVQYLVEKTPSVTPENPLISLQAIKSGCFYDLLLRLDSVNNDPSINKDVYQQLRRLPLWPSNKGIVSAYGALLPGNFTDPTGMADLLDITFLKPSIREFLNQKLNVPFQTIIEFIKNVLPRFFSKNGHMNVAVFKNLISELLNHPSLFDNNEIKTLLTSLPMIPTLDGGWSRAADTYIKTDSLLPLLGDNKALWVDFNRLPNTQMIKSFVENLGVKRRPTIKHLIDRLIYLSESSRATIDAKRASAEVFYALCDQLDEFKNLPDFNDLILEIKGSQCFPSDSDDKWHFPKNLYAFYRAEGFKSQAKILDFKNTNRLENELLEKIGISINPKTNLVVNHLLWCARNKQKPNLVVYQILNEKERLNSDKNEYISLGNEACIYLEEYDRFIKPNQIYWTKQKLGQYTFTASGAFDTYKDFFKAIGLKDSPNIGDYISILTAIVSDQYDKGGTILKSDRTAYDECMLAIALSDSIDPLDEEQIEALQQIPLVVNSLHQLVYVDDVVIKDSEWHAAFFGDSIDASLWKPIPEIEPLLYKLGVQKISQCVDIFVDYIEGEKISEHWLEAAIKERTDLFFRILHDKISKDKNKVIHALSNLSIFSHDLLKVKAKMVLGDSDRTIESHSVSSKPFYDINKSELLLSRPITDSIWSPILNCMLHQLMPSESSSEISKITLSLRPLMTMNVALAHQELTEGGVPAFEFHEVYTGDDIYSSEVSSIDTQTDEGFDSQTIDTETRPSINSASRENRDKKFSDFKAMAEALQSSPTVLNGSEGMPPKSTLTNNKADSPLIYNSNDGHIHDPFVAKSSDKKASNIKKDPKNRQQWDRKLISYVTSRSDSNREHSGDLSEHNLAVEAVARNAVCAYERTHGRIPEQMSQTHPGYDIVSKNALTGEERYIEVKGINHAWGQTGVGLSSMQFSNAQDYGDKYWLYVVENISQPESISVYPIQNPAIEVGYFMFDQNWKAIALTEKLDETAAFVTGAYIEHKTFGKGLIKSFQIKGRTRILDVDFETYDLRTITLDLSKMEVVNSDD